MGERAAWEKERHGRKSGMGEREAWEKERHGRKSGMGERAAWEKERPWQESCVFVCEWAWIAVKVAAW